MLLCIFCSLNELYSIPVAFSVWQIFKPTLINTGYSKIQQEFVVIAA